MCICALFSSCQVLFLLFIGDPLSFTGLKQNPTFFRMLEVSPRYERISLRVAASPVVVLLLCPRGLVFSVLLQGKSGNPQYSWRVSLLWLYSPTYTTKLVDLVQLTVSVVGLPMFLPCPHCQQAPCGSWLLPAGSPRLAFPVVDTTCQQHVTPNLCSPIPEPEGPSE